MSMPIMRPCVLFRVSQHFLRQTNHICQKHNVAATMNSPVVTKRSNSIRSDRIPHKQDNNPDVFGTLSSRETRYSQKFDSLIYQGQSVDEGDKLEEKYLSFQPADRKSVEQFEKEIEQLLAEKRLKDALLLLEVTLKEDRVKPSRGMYSMLIGACGRTGYTKKAFSLFNQMKKRGFDPTESHYTALFNSCANSPWPDDGLQRAISLRQQLSDKNVLLNRAQYNAMLKAFGRCGDVATAFEIIDEMASNQLPVTTESFNFLLQACISSPKQGFSQAIQVWRRIRYSRVTPEIYSYNLMLRATRDCGVEDVNANKGQPFESLLQLEGKKKAQRSDDLQVNFPLNNTRSELTTLAHHQAIPNLLAEHIEFSNVMAMTGLERTENRLALFGGIEGFLEQMKKDHVRPDIKTFTLLLETIASHPKEEKVLLEQMKVFKVTPDVDFFNLLIKKRQFRRDNSGAKDVLNYLQEYKLFPNVMTFGVLAMGCDSLPAAELFFDSMKNAGFRMNIEIFGCLLKNAVVRKNCFYIVDLLKIAEKLNLALDDRAVKLLDRFKRETMEAMAKHDRGLKVPDVYGDKNFRKKFKTFCTTFSPMMKNLEVALDPHPWQQFRYPLDKKGENEP